MEKRTNTARWVESKKQWRVDVQRDGLRRSFYSGKPGRTGQREANAKADAWLSSGMVLSHRRCGEWLDEYLKHIETNTSVSHYKQVRSNLETHIRPVLGPIKDCDLTEAHLQKVLDNAANVTSKYGRPLAKKSLSNIRAVLTNFCRYLRKAGVSSLHPEDLVISKKAPSVEKKILQPTDLHRLFSCTQTKFRGKVIDDPYIHAYRFAVLTGLRPGELIGLEWQDISGATVRVNRAVNYLGETTPGKNKNAQRSFALSDLALNEIQQQRQLTGGKSVFCIPTQASFRNSWYRFCDHNGIPRVTPYELRHTFVSAAQSLPEGELKALVGHSASMDTFGVYAHLISGQQERTAGHVEDIFQLLLAAGK